MNNVHIGIITSNDVNQKYFEHLLEVEHLHEIQLPCSLTDIIELA